VQSALNERHLGYSHGKEEIGRNKCRLERPGPLERDVNIQKKKGTVGVCTYDQKRRGEG
jgi:hypothetical protein